MEMYRQELLVRDEAKEEWLEESIRESVKEWKKLGQNQMKKPTIKTPQQFEALKKAADSVERKPEATPKIIEEEFEVIKPTFQAVQTDFQGYAKLHKNNYIRPPISSKPPPKPSSVISG